MSAHPLGGSPGLQEALETGAVAQLLGSYCSGDTASALTAMSTAGKVFAETLTVALAPLQNIYICGGMDAERRALRSVERLDPSAPDAWHALPPMTEARRVASLATVAA